MRVRIDLDTIRENADVVQRQVDGDVVGVVKGVGARREVVDAFVGAGIDRIAVSRVEHLARLQDVEADLVMLRTPAFSEIPDVVSLADVALHGSPAVVEATGDVAERRGTTHDVVAMVDAGDGREGVPLDQAGAFLEAIEGHDHLRLREVGVNLGCFGTVPDPDAVHRVADRLPDYRLSVGGTGMLLVHDRLPAAVGSYRVGDALLTGTYQGTPIEGLQRGSVELQAEVLARKPDGAVIDVGNVNSDPRHLVPADGVSILRSSNELSVIDAEVAEGDHVPFEMEYDAIATTFNSKYV